MLVEVRDDQRGIVARVAVKLDSPSVLKVKPNLVGFLVEVGVYFFFRGIKPFGQLITVKHGISSRLDLAKIVVDSKKSALPQIKYSRILSITGAAFRDFLNVRGFANPVLVHSPPYGTVTHTICRVFEAIIVRPLLIGFFSA